MGASGPARLTDETLASAVAEWLPGLRWFAGKGHRVTDSQVLARADIPGPAAGQTVVHLIVGVQLDGSAWQVYQTPLLLSSAAIPELAAKAVPMPDIYCYDALAHNDAPALLVGWVADHPEVDPARTHGSGQALPQLQALWDPSGYLAEPARALSVEQSNTSLRFGGAALMKVFRRLIPGINPDVEVSAALAEVGCTDTAEILGWVNGAWRDPETPGVLTGHLGMVQQLLSPAVDGWDLSRERVGEGADFAADSYRLGLATGAVHRDLRRVLPTHVLDPAEVAELADRLHERLDRAAAEVPDLAELLPALHARISALTNLEEPIRVQRVHGDYHLGQVLLAGDGWKLLDFEGEPGGAISQRIIPDHPLRDVAAMLRSYDYAAHMGGQGRDPAEVANWTAECTDEFLRGYRDAASGDQAAALAPGTEQILLHAYTVDKAAYEAVYEKRNRPTWLAIPLTALRQVAG